MANIADLGRRLFLKPVASDGAASASAKPVNDGPSVYASAQRAWNDIYGSAVNEKKFWRAAALVLAAALLVDKGIGAFRAQELPFKPYVVQFNGDHHVVADQLGDTIDDRMRRYALRTFVEAARTVTNDKALQQRAVRTALAMVPAQSRCLGTINEMIQARNRGGASEVTVSVSRVNAVRETDSSWSLEWREVTRGATGRVSAETSWRASIAATDGTVRSQDAAMLNPFGIFITDCDWQERR